MTDLEKLTHFMKPFYQDAGDQTLLQAYLTDYTYPECAAAALWEELASSASMQASGISEIDTGAEKFKYFAPDTVHKTALASAKIYNDRCAALTGQTLCMVRVKQSDVAGIPGKPLT